MASTCGSTLALMDAGVPIESPVAGISIGMVTDGEKYELLTDIIGLEDFSGDMDFKVAGTEFGVTAVQLDVKIKGLTIEQIIETFTRARTARMQILETMLSVIPSSRSAVSEYAPKIEVIQIPMDKIGEVIGPGGKNIRAITAQTGATVDIEDDGTVTISGISEEEVKKALNWVEGITREVATGEVFEGVVKRILPFGAFVEYLPGREGMVHVSRMRRGFVKDPTEVVSLGQKVKVKIEERDQQGRINLSMIFDEDEGEGQPQTQNQTQMPPQKPREQYQSRPRNDYPPFRGNRDNDRNSSRSEHPLSRALRREELKKKNFGKKRYR
jgi:polyribonucleotide nucleotidyltransferase